MPSEILRLSNFDFSNQSSRSEIASYAPSGQSQILLQSSSGFATERFVVLAPGTELAEIHQIDSIPDNLLTLKTELINIHQPGTVVLQLVGNQIKVYRAPNTDGKVPADDDFTHLAATAPENPIDIQPDQTFTAATDPDGGIDYWYKATYYHSETETETDLSLALAVRGGDFGHYASLSDIREQAGFSIFDNITDMQVDLARSQAESEINSILGSVGYQLPISVQVPLLASITQLLAAGHLLSRSYGSGAEGTTKDGAALRKSAYDMLNRLSGGTGQLVDIDGNVLTNTAGSSGVDQSVEGSYREPSFRMGDVF